MLSSLKLVFFADIETYNVDTQLNKVMVTGNVTTEQVIRVLQKIGKNATAWEDAETNKWIFFLSVGELNTVSDVLQHVLQHSHTYPAQVPELTPLYKWTCLE